VLEDADDIGWLSVTDSEIQFIGDSVRLNIPLSQVRELHSENIGLRALFVYGSRVSLVVSGVPKVDCIEIAERSSLLLPCSRRTARRLHDAISRRLREYAGRQSRIQPA
jgi:hypothetical protein